MPSRKKASVERSFLSTSTSSVTSKKQGKKQKVVAAALPPQKNGASSRSTIKDIEPVPARKHRKRKVEVESEEDESDTESEPSPVTTRSKARKSHAGNNGHISEPETSLEPRILRKKSLRSSASTTSTAKFSDMPVNGTAGKNSFSASPERNGVAFQPESMGMSSEKYCNKPAAHKSTAMFPLPDTVHNGDVSVEFFPRNGQDDETTSVSTTADNDTSMNRRSKLEQLLQLSKSRSAQASLSPEVQFAEKRELPRLRSHHKCDVYVVESEQRPQLTEAEKQGIKRGRPRREETVRLPSVPDDEEEDEEEFNHIAYLMESPAKPKKRKRPKRGNGAVANGSSERAVIDVAQEKSTKTAKTDVIEQEMESPVCSRLSPSDSNEEILGDEPFLPTHLKKAKRIKPKPKQVDVVIPTKPVSCIVGAHPLIPAGSTRQAVAPDIKSLMDVIPATLRERSLATLLTSHPLVLTQTNVVHERWKHISESKLLLKRSLSYSIIHRRLRGPVPLEKRTTVMKSRSVECIIQQLWARKMHPVLGTPRFPGTCSYPVDLEVTSFTLTKLTDSEQSGQMVSTPSRKEVDVQFVVMRKNPNENLVRDMLQPVLACAPKVMGVVNGTKTVNFIKSRVRLEFWNPSDYLVVNLDSAATKQVNKSVAFNIGDIKEGMVLEVTGHYTMKVVVKRPVPPGPSKVDYKFVIVFSAGQHYQAREMVALKNPYKGHSCLFCRVRCDSLVNLLRHFEGLHPSLGYQFDPDTRRLYVWFAPEHDFLRPDVPGVVDLWTALRYKTRQNGSRILYPDTATTHYPVGGRPVFQWMSSRYAPHQQADSLPIFKMDHLLRIYGIPVNPVRHYLHTDAVQTIRPDLGRHHAYDSDEDTEWQDKYEHAKIHDFVDCSTQEKRFMCLWNAFTRRLSPIFSLGMREVLCRFAVQHAVEIDMLEGYPPLCAQLSMFRRENIITAAESLEVVRTYRDTLACMGDRAQCSKKEKDIKAESGV